MTKNANIIQLESDVLHALIDAALAVQHNGYAHKYTYVRYLRAHSAAGHVWPCPKSRRKCMENVFLSNYHVIRDCI